MVHFDDRSFTLGPIAYRLNDEWRTDESEARRRERKYLIFFICLGSFREEPCRAEIDGSGEMSEECSMLLRLTVEEHERVSQSLLAGTTHGRGGLQEKSTDHSIYMEDKAMVAPASLRFVMRTIENRRECSFALWNARWGRRRPPLARSKLNRQVDFY